MGLLTPELEKRYELIAWRYLAGLPLDAVEQKALGGDSPAAVDATAAPRHPDGLETWRAAIHEPQRFWNTSKVSQAGKFDYYLNCHDDAFATAASTLTDRRESYGRPSLVDQWVAAQNRVFENCSGKDAVYPAEADASLPPVARADRAYQIAAAHFYAEDFEGARQRFGIIAADSGSPWAKTSAYMLGRVALREFSLLHKPGALEQARAAFAKVGDAKMLRYVEALANPKSVFEAAARGLTEAHPGAGIAQTLNDAVYAMSTPQYQSAWLEGELPEPFDWIRTFEKKDQAHALNRWHETHGVAWLVAALVGAGGKDADAQSLIDAAGQVSVGSSAYDAATVEAIRLQIEGGHGRVARERLNRLLAGKHARLISVENALRGERMQVATGFEDFLRWAPRRPIGYAEDMGDSKFDRSAILDADSLLILNSKTPVKQLAEAATGAILPPWIAADIARVTFTRAFMLDDGAVAREMIPVLKKTHPRWGSDLAAIDEATGDAARFAGAMAILRHASLYPWLQSDFRGEPEQDGWWCQVNAPKGSIAEVAALGKAGGDKEVLGPIVLAWARVHPEDKRNPEALGRVVRVTRYGCRAGGDGKVSKAAFDLLHGQYPKDAWTARTPYWFK